MTSVSDCTIVTCTVADSVEKTLGHGIFSALSMAVWSKEDISDFFWFFLIGTS